MHTKNPEHPRLEEAWRQALGHTLDAGHAVAPRGHRTKEVMHRTFELEMRYPVLRNPLRKLSYRFMAAEAYWILSGDDRVETISPYNPVISGFSDDGKTFFGAYGPKILAQLPYVLEKLAEDPVTRQAGLTIWRESPPATKDVPCTVAIFCSRRNGYLHLHVFMRSSDLWLGLPYDVFNLSMLGHLICARLNRGREADLLRPGCLFLTAASSHLYERDWATARQCLDVVTDRQPATPEVLWKDPEVLMETLRLLRETSPGDPLRWWELR